MSRLSVAVYKAVSAILLRVYPAPRVEGVENLPDGPCVIVGNHAQMHGPIIAALFLPGECRIWCAAEMMHLKEVPAYAYRDFWSRKPRRVRWLFRIASYLIAPLAAGVFNGGECIGVYRDSRVMSTFRETLACLSEGVRVVIFPEEDAPGNGIVWSFQRGFVDVARLYCAREKKPLSFVPMYVAPALRRVVLGAPVEYRPGGDPEAERERVCAALTDAITQMALALPPHTVVPYPNLPKAEYPQNHL